MDKKRIKPPVWIALAAILLAAAALFYAPVVRRAASLEYIAGLCGVEVNRLDATGAAGGFWEDPHALAGRVIGREYRFHLGAQGDIVAVARMGNNAPPLLEAPEDANDAQRIALQFARRASLGLMWRGYSAYTLPGDDGDMPGWLTIINRTGPLGIATGERIEVHLRQDGVLVEYIHRREAGRAEGWPLPRVPRTKAARLAYLYGEEMMRAGEMTPHDRFDLHARNRHVVSAELYQQPRTSGGKLIWIVEIYQLREDEEYPRRNCFFIDANTGEFLSYSPT